MTRAAMVFRAAIAGLALVAGTSPTAAQDAPQSGYAYMEPATKALQDDDFLNPGFFLVDEGLALWNRAMGPDGQSCAGCHGEVETAMRGVAARYPEYDPDETRLLNLELRIQSEMANRMNAEPFAYGTSQLLALTAVISLQSRGMDMRPDTSAEAQPYLAQGRAIYEARRGQLNLACGNCHDDHAGDRLRGDVISQGQINAFPIYRLLWGEAGSRHRMFEWCMQSIRAEPYERGSEEFVALELYLAERGAGLPIEAPGVRR